MLQKQLRLEPSVYKDAGGPTNTGNDRLTDFGFE